MEMPDKTLREVADELANEIAGNVAAQFAFNGTIPRSLPDQILKACETCMRDALAEPSEAMVEAGNEQFRRRVGPGSCWRAMAAVRLEELK
jgi:hypothetical protein